MLNHLLRLALAVTIGLLTYYTAYSILNPYDEHIAALAAYGLLFSTPLPLILAFYGKAKWAGRLFVGSWLAYGVIIASFAIWSAMEALPMGTLALVLISGGSTLALYVLHRSGKIEWLLQLLRRKTKAEEEPEVQPIEIEKELKTIPMPEIQPKQEVEFELKEPQPLRNEWVKVIDMDESIGSIDGLDCKILLALMTTGSVSSKKELALATGATYKRILSSTKRLQEANLIEIRREIIRGRRGAVIRHSIDITSNVDRKQLELLVRQRLEKLGKWGIIEG